VFIQAWTVPAVDFSFHFDMRFVICTKKTYSSEKTEKALPMKAGLLDFQ